MKRHLLTGHDETVAKFVAQFAPIERPKWTEPYWGFGVLRDDGRLVAGYVVSDWQPDFKRCELSFATVSSFAINTGIVTAIGGFVFEQLGAYRVFARTGVNNHRAKKLMRNMGFLEEAIQGHHYGPGVHASCWRLLKPEWEAKWAAKAQEAA